MDARALRKDFPVLDQRVNGRPLVYLDSAATAQKPRPVIDAVRRFFEEDNANVHRAIHALGERATAKYEEARRKVARFINAPSERTIIFTKNATESINLVAYSWARARLKPGDEILVSPIEHHSNLVPWQLAARATGATLRFFDVTEDGQLRLDNLDSLISERTRLVAVTHVSNVLGTIVPVASIVAAARRAGAVVLVDGAQSVPHMPVDVQALGCDFFAFSGHKMGAPTGIGVLYGREELLEAMDPFLGGGDMISSVRLSGSEWAELPYKFEAGTPPIAEAIGLGAAIDYLTAIGMDRVHAYERRLTAYARERLEQLPGITIYGPKERGGLLTFNVDEIHPHDLATVLDQHGIAIRAGHHCAQPVMEWLGVPATARASFWVYNTEDDVERLVEGLRAAKEFFGYVA
ncbi:MAG: cysteine desulfurase [Firmicutes bacterium ZCTH02-B6]|nr:MAG: cysteine desulfurase [Firmicutes bacterium ZCTH02-B6]